MVLSMEINFKFVIKLEKKKKRLSNLVHKLKTTGILVHKFESSIFEIVFADSINYKIKKKIQHGMILEIL